MTTADLNLSKPLSYWDICWIKFKSNPLAFFAAIYLLFLIICSLIIPFISPYTYYDIDLALKNESPSVFHWFGTDDLGRDMFTRIWYGMRISLFVGMTAAIIDLFIGTLWGGTAALLGGKIEQMMMRLIDIISAIPSLLMIISLIVVIGSGLHAIILALALFGWMTMARVVRGQFLQLKEQPYILAAKALGASFWRIFFRHLLPNASAPMIVTLTFTIPSAIFTEAFLSYLGLGIQAPIASLGTMAKDGLAALEYYPWRLFFPAAFISTTMLAFNLIGDGLSDATSTH